MAENLTVSEGELNGALGADLSIDLSSQAIDSLAEKLCLQLWIRGEIDHLTNKPPSFLTGERNQAAEINDAEVRKMAITLAYALGIVPIHENPDLERTDIQCVPAMVALDAYTVKTLIGLAEQLRDPGRLSGEAFQLANARVFYTAYAGGKERQNSMLLDGEAFKKGNTNPGETALPLAIHTIGYMVKDNPIVGCIGHKQCDLLVAATAKAMINFSPGAGDSSSKDLSMMSVPNPAAELPEAFDFWLLNYTKRATWLQTFREGHLKIDAASNLARVVDSELETRQAMLAELEKVQENLKRPNPAKVIERISNVWGYSGRER